METGEAHGALDDTEDRFAATKRIPISRYVARSIRRDENTPFA